MSASPLMSMGIKAMAANYAALQTTSHNIANANVAGFSRQQVELATAQGQFSGAGFFGQGVNVVAVTRAHDEFLTREAAGARALAGMDAARLAQLQRLEAVFRPGETGLGHAADAFLNSMVDLVSRPADGAVRQVVLARAGDLAARYAEAGAALDDLQAGVGAELNATVAQVNALARGIADTNQRITALRGLGQPANDLLDQREQLVSELSQLVKTSRIEADDGSMAVFIGGGQSLVLGAEAARLKVVPDPADPSRAALAVDDGGALRALGQSALGGGAIAGLLRFQNQDLVDARNLVGQLAAAVGGAVNEQQRRGLSLESPAQAGKDLFALGPALALPHAGNARDAGGAPLGSVALTISDPAALQASEYDLRQNPADAGQWQLTRLRDGLVRTVASGEVVDGVRIDFGNPGPQGGDRFLLQPVARAANGMRVLLADPRELAAAAPLVASGGPGNVGSVAVARLDVNAAPLPVPGASTRITFTDDNGGYTWELLDTGNATLASGSGSWQPGRPVPAPPLDINGFSLQLGGVPRTGDTLTVEP
ncbi:MAG TPA: flagellar hook-associated protein FlgK, partial [Rubrivivax sp.]|nr:flagellar hook-associated protein FlgK [Rubrivivax sp.]